MVQARSRRHGQPGYRCFRLTKQLGHGVRPGNIKRFEILMYLAAGIDLASLPLLWTGMPPIEYALSALWVLFICSLVWLAAHRRANWARWLLLALFCFTTFMQLYVSRPLPLMAN